LFPLPRPPASSLCPYTTLFRSRRGVETVHGAGAPDHLLPLEPVRGLGVPLDRERVASQPDEELSRLGRESGRKRKREQGDQEIRGSGAHGYFLVKGIETRVVSQSIRMTPPLPCGRTAIVSCSTGRGSDSVFASTRTKSESAA